MSPSANSCAPASTWLIAVSIGPVQGFIAAARRTRDLWFGSLLLSEISRATALRIVGEPGAQLIFPAAPDGSGLSYLQKGSGAPVSNVVLATLPADTDPALLSQQLKSAAEHAWKEFAQAALPPNPAWIVRPRWQEQLEGVVELSAAWLPLGDYVQTRAELMRLLAARKSCRDFSQWQGIFGVPKSSLDGGRETVLAELPKAQAEARAVSLKINEGEQLDAVGLTKRLGGTRRQYPSVSRVAADTWLRSLTPQDREALAAACNPLTKSGLVRLNPDRFPQYRDFPYERAAIYLNRTDEAAEEVPEADRPALLSPLRAQLQRLHSIYGEPSPYLAILIADGDRMGEFISTMDAATHRSVSAALSGFATAAARQVANHNGALVYAGGDDVLAFLPVDRALQCARALHDAFAAALAPWGKATLSVGLAIGHMMEPLEDLLEYARDAERTAKHPDRNGLAVAVHARSGSPVIWRSSWRAAPDNLLAMLTAALAGGEIPDKAAYDLQRLARFYRGYESAAQTQPGWLAPAMEADVLRVLARKRSTGGTGLKALEAMVYANVKTPADLENLASSLLIARRLQPAPAREEAA